MKTHGGVDVYIHVFLVSAFVGGEWSASRPGSFNLGKISYQNLSRKRGEDKNLTHNVIRTPTPRSFSL
jgi:hypothetical protein